MGVLSEAPGLNPDVPVLICSAYPKLGNDPYVITMGVVGFINKPISIDTLREEVARALEPETAQTFTQDSQWGNVELEKEEA